MDKAISRLIAAGDLERTEIGEIKVIMNRVMNHPELKPYFKVGLIVKNETDIVLANGDLLRPDRVVIDGNTACVIDFKTGMRKAEHDTQIIAYKSKLIDMGYQDVKSLLVYTHDLEVMEV